MIEKVSLITEKLFNRISKVFDNTILIIIETDIETAFVSLPIEHPIDYSLSCYSRLIINTEIRVLFVEYNFGTVDQTIDG